MKNAFNKLKKKGFFLKIIEFILINSKIDITPIIIKKYPKTN